MDKQGKRCRYKDCTSSGRGVSYYKFPVNPEQREDWKIATQCGDINLNNALICGKHFYPEDFSNVTDLRSRLKSGTVPIGYRNNGILVHAKSNSAELTPRAKTTAESTNQKPKFKMYQSGRITKLDAEPNVICEMIDSPSSSKVGSCQKFGTEDENAGESFSDDDFKILTTAVKKMRKSASERGEGVTKSVTNRNTTRNLSAMERTIDTASTSSPQGNPKRVTFSDSNETMSSPVFPRPTPNPVPKASPNSQNLVIGAKKVARVTPSTQKVVVNNNAVSGSPSKGYIYKIVYQNNAKILVKCSDESPSVSEATFVKTENVEETPAAPGATDLVAETGHFCALCRGYPDFLPLPPKLFPFPKTNRVIQRKWEALTQIPLDTWHPDLRICSVHFPPESFIRKEGKLELKPNAIPTIIVNSQVKEEKCTIVPAIVDKTGTTPINTRCAVCCANVLTSDAVPIFNERQHFTEFGVALASILKTTSQPLNYSHCCASCSGHVVTCYSAIMDINAAAQITMKRDFLRILPSPEAYAGSVALNEKCPKCNEVCFSFKDYVSHTTQHFYEAKRNWIVHKGNEKSGVRTTTGTQIDELQLEMEYDEQAMNELFGDKNRKRKSKTKEIKVEVPELPLVAPVDGSAIIKDESEADIVMNEIDWKNLQVDDLRSPPSSVPTEEVEEQPPPPPPPDAQNGDRSFICHICGKGFQTKKTCRQHVNRHNDEKGLNVTKCCHICGRNVKQKYWWIHQRYHRDPCRICGKKVVYMQQHMQLHKKSDITFLANECSDCGKTFEQRGLLRVHMFLKHGASPNTFTRGRTFQENWRCNLCDEVFDTYKKIHHHARSEHNGKGINMPCEECGKIYNNLQSLSTHALSAHSNYYSTKCRHCGNWFVSEEKHQQHVKFTCRKLHGSPKKSLRSKKSTEGQYAANTIIPEGEISDEADMNESAISVDNLDASAPEYLEEGEELEEEATEVIYEELDGEDSAMDEPSSQNFQWAFVQQSPSSNHDRL